MKENMTEYVSLEERGHYFFEIYQIHFKFIKYGATIPPIHVFRVVPCGVIEKEREICPF